MDRKIIIAGLVVVAVAGVGMAVFCTTWFLPFVPKQEVQEPSVALENGVKVIQPVSYAYVDLKNSSFDTQIVNADTQKVLVASTKKLCGVGVRALSFDGEASVLYAQVNSDGFDRQIGDVYRIATNPFVCTKLVVSDFVKLPGYHVLSPDGKMMLLGLEDYPRTLFVADFVRDALIPVVQLPEGETLNGGGAAMSIYFEIAWKDQTHVAYTVYKEDTKFNKSSPETKVVLRRGVAEVK